MLFSRQRGLFIQIAMAAFIGCIPLISSIGINNQYAHRISDGYWLLFNSQLDERISGLSWIARFSRFRMGTNEIHNVAGNSQSRHIDDRTFRVGEARSKIAIKYKFLTFRDRNTIVINDSRISNRRNSWSTIPKIPKCNFEGIVFHHCERFWKLMIVSHCLQQWACNVFLERTEGLFNGSTCPIGLLDDGSNVISEVSLISKSGYRPIDRTNFIDLAKARTVNDFTVRRNPNILRANKNNNGSGTSKRRHKIHEHEKGNYSSYHFRVTVDPEIGWMVLSDENNHFRYKQPRPRYI
jgi:hypothetical protein